MTPGGLRRLVGAVLDAATNHGSPIHGPHHWRCVGLTGARLAAADPRADGAVVFLFALLHDAMREDDGRDPDHGRRAAQLARRLHAAGALPLAAGPLSRLVHACALHADGEVAGDPTTAACWDADRLHLPRVGIEPWEGLLSTEVARRELADEVAAADAVREREHDWPDVAAAFGAALAPVLA